MPDLVSLPNGLVQVTEDTGESYNIDAGFARQLYPEQFAPEPAQPTGPGMLDPNAPQMPMAPQQEVPPMLQPGMGVPAALSPDAVMPGAPPEALAPSGGAYDPGQAPTGPAAPQAPVQSRSVGGSVSYSRPYREQPKGMYPGAIDYSGLGEGAAQALSLRQQGIEGLARATAEHDAGLEQRYAEMAAQREDTAREHAAMREGAMMAVQQSEAELDQRRDQMQRMDMNKVWKDTSSKAKLVGILSAGIAGWLNPTGENSVVNQMMQLADQSAREQAANMAQERFQMGMAERGIGRMESRAAVDQQQYLAERSLLEANVVDQIALEKSKYSSQVTIAKLVEAEAAATEKYMDTRRQHAESVWNQNMQVSMQRAQDARQRAQLRAAAARQKASFRHDLTKAKLAGGAGQLPPQFMKGKPLFVRDDGRTVYAKHGLEISPTEKDKFDTAVTISRQLAADSKRLAALVHKHGRAVKLLEPSQVAAIEQELNNLVEDMRPKVGANLPKDEAGRVESQFGSPKSILKSPETTMKLINRQIRRQGSIIDQGLAQWGATTGTPVTQDGQQIPSPEGGYLEHQERYQRGTIGEMFGPEFEGLDFSKAMEAEAIDSINEITALRNQLSETSGEAARDSIEDQIIESAVGLLSYAQKQGLNSEQNSALYSKIGEVTVGIDPIKFKGVAFGRGLLGAESWGDPGRTPAGEFARSSDYETTGAMLGDVVMKEIGKHGNFRAHQRAVNGQGPLSREEWDRGAKYLEEND